MDDKVTDLVLQMWNDGDDTGVFFTAETHQRLQDIEEALAKAKTWRDFESLCPEGEFESFFWWCNDGEYIYEIDGDYRFIDPAELEEFWRVLGASHVIHADQPFDRMNSPFWEAPDYPYWTAMTADDLLPDEFVALFGGGSGGPASGSWFEYPMSEAEAMEEWLEEHGFTMETCNYYV